MGFFYTNVTVKEASQEEIVDCLRRVRRDAYVSPTVNGVTVVYDREMEDQDEVVIKGLTFHISESLDVPALAALLHDDDVFWYALFEHGEQTDEYNSEPSYFDADPDAELLPPSGGDARRLALAFGATARVDEIEEVLRRWDGDDPDEYVGAEDRHRQLAEALGFPAYAYSMGYYSIAVGNVPEGVDLSQLVRLSAPETRAGT